MPFEAIVVATNSKPDIDTALVTAVANDNLILLNVVTLIAVLKQAALDMFQPHVPVDAEELKNKINTAYQTCMTNLA